MAYGRLIAQIKKCYNKVTVGKAIWKQVMMAALMFGKAVVTHSNTDIGKIQAIEYKVYRYLIGVAGYVAVASLRSEIGASQIITRVMDTILLFAKDTLDGEFTKVKKHMETEIQKNKGNWINRTNKYLENLKISWEQLRKMDRKEIKIKI